MLASNPRTRLLQSTLMSSLMRHERRYLVTFAVTLGAAAIALLLLIVGLLTSSDEHPLSRANRAAVPPPAHVSPGERLFAPSSLWNARLPADAPVDPNSLKLIRSLNDEVQSEIARHIGPWIATSLASVPLYIVPANQPDVRVQLDGPPVPGHVALQQAFDGVPIPPSAEPAAGADRHMAIWQPSTDRMWEFFKASHLPNGWVAEWGGAMRHVSDNPGYYGPDAWPGATSNWGATATSLPAIAGVILLQDLKAGVIEHALAIDLPYPRAGVFAWPAQRSDGEGSPETLPEGARLRLNPELNLNQLSLPPLTRMIAEAAQRYGMIVRDQTLHGISLFGEDPVNVPGPNPYYGRDGVYGSLTPGQIMDQFPWSDLEVLKLHLCTRTPCPAPSGAS